MTTEERNKLSAFDEPPITPDEEALSLQLQQALRDLDQRGSPQQNADLDQSPNDVRSAIEMAEKLMQAGRRLRSLAFSSNANSPSEGLERTIPTPFPDEFRFVRLLGEGSFGEVWLAEDLKLGREVAIKTIRAQTGDASTLDALRNEATLLGSLAHPNVVPVFSWRESRNSPFLVMKLVRGVSFDKRVDAEGPLHWQDAAQYVADVGDGLLHLHIRGIIHRDIKPSNILWDEEQNEACITDLGISARLCDARGIAGSLPFVAPEVFEGDVWIGNDVYSLGATLFWLLTGKRPFSGTSASEIVAQIRQGLPDDDPRCYAIPDAVESLIRSALDADRNKRIDLKTFVATLRSEVNKLLVDTLATYPATSKQSSVDLKLTLSKEVSSGCYEPLATTPAPFYRSRDMKKVPRRPEQVRLKTGDFVRIEVETNMAGYLAVWNVGPTGNLNLLHPEDFPESPENWPHTQSATPLHVLDVQMAKPPGKERLFAMWTRRAPTIRLKDLSSVGHADGAMKRYCATRDMKRVKRFVDQLAPSDFRVVVIGVDHQ